jgi:ribosomal protein L37AE/L43A
MAACENCKADGKESLAMVRLGDGTWLCADCWEEVKDDCKPIEGGDE